MTIPKTKKLPAGNPSLATMIAIGLAASLAGCGGGDSAGPASALTSSTVLGSYFRDAKVCLDSNANAQCDSGGTSVRSDNNGKYELPGSGAMVVAEIGTDAKEYDPVSQTEKAVAGKITLRAPREAPGMISLHFASVVAEMETNGPSYAAALKKVALAVGVTTDRLLTDFNTGTDATVRAASTSASDDGLKRLQDSLAGAQADADIKNLVATAATTDRFYQTKAPYTNPVS